MTDTIIAIVLIVISLILLIKVFKGGSCDYKTRIRTYCAIYKDEIYFVDTKRPEVVKYIEEMCEDYLECKKRDFKIVIKYMSKLKYSLMREI